MLVIEIIAGKRNNIDRPDADYDTIRRIAGGPLETAFLLANPCGEGDIIGYANADWQGLRLNCRIEDREIHGPLVIVGVGPAGEHRSLTHEELDFVKLYRTQNPWLPELRFG